MKRSIVFLMISLLSGGCSMQPSTKDLSIRMKLWQDEDGMHYVRAEITNNSIDNLYVPHMRNFISIFKNDIDITTAVEYSLPSAIWDNEFCEDDISTISVDELIMTYYTPAYSEYIDNMMMKEWEGYKSLNNIDESRLSADELHDIKFGYKNLFYEKYDGIVVKSDETINMYINIECLYSPDVDMKNDAYLIRFTRNCSFPDIFYEIARYDPYKFYTPLMESDLDYIIYTNEIYCDDVIKLK